MTKFRVKLALKERDVPNKVEFGGIVHTAMTGNTDFTTPNPSLADLLAATGDLDTAFQNSKHGVLSTTVLNDAEDAWDTLMTALGKYVDSIAKGSKDVINGAGMDTAETSHVPLTMTMVIGVEGRSGKLSGEINWKWKPVKGARLYFGYLKEADNPSAVYQLVVFSTKTKTVVSGLTPGVKYLLQVKAVGASGFGPLSDASSAYAAF